MGFSQRKSLVFLVQALHAHAASGKSVRKRLAAATYASSRTSHDLDEVVTRLLASLRVGDKIEDFSGVAEAVRHSNPDRKPVNIQPSPL